MFTNVICITVGYTMDTMFFGWLDNPVDVDKDVQLPQFTLVDVILYDCSQNYTAGNKNIWGQFNGGLLLLVPLFWLRSGEIFNILPYCPTIYWFLTPDVSIPFTQKQSIMKMELCLINTKNFFIHPSLIFTICMLI